MNFYEDFLKLPTKDRKEVLNLMQYKIQIDNKNFKNRIEYLENIIEGLESDVRVLGEHIEDDCTAHEEALKWCKEAQELDYENAKLRNRINKAIEYASKNPHPEWEQVVEDVLISGKTILNILRGE